MLRYLTPHGKWNIHSTYQDNLHMLTLFRGGPTVWINNDDARRTTFRTTIGWKYTTATALSPPAPSSATGCRKERCTCIMRRINTSTCRARRLRRIAAAPQRADENPCKADPDGRGYAQLSYGFNYYGPIGNQRDVYVAVRKMKEVDWLED